MVAVALLFDAITAAPKLLDLIPFLDALTIPANLIVGALVSLFAYLTFWFWFQRHGVKFIKSPKRLLTFPVAFFIKLIPFIGALPAWTAAVVFIFLNVRAEDLLTKTEVGAKVVGGAAKVAGKLGANKQKMKEVAEKAKEVEQGAKETRERMAKAKKGEVGKEGTEEQIGGQHYADTMQALQPDSRQHQGQSGAIDMPHNDEIYQASQNAATARMVEKDPTYEKEFGHTFSEGERAAIAQRRQRRTEQRERNQPNHDIGQQPVFRQTPQSAQKAGASAPTQSGTQPAQGSPPVK